jgi:cation diffusion facilitator family transporter
MANRPADKDHPFGHGRAEWVTAILIGVFLGYIGISFLMESISQLRSGSKTEFGGLAWIVLAISILGKEGLAQYAFYQGRKFQAKSVIADGWHHRSDALSSVIILVGLLIGKNFWWIDGVLGILVSFFIFYATYEILADIFKTLLGEKPDEITQQRLKTLINDVSGRDLYLHHIHIHNYVNHKELTFHIRLPSHMSLQEAHAIASRIEKKINVEMEMQATIHMEPLSK